MDQLGDEQHGSPALDRDPRRSAPLPAWHYVSPEAFAAERAGIFFRSWKYAAHVSELAGPGSFITLNLLDQSIALVRGHDDLVRAFFNVCQHRAHELLKGEGAVSAIRCPYHAWTYDLTGALRQATKAGDQVRCETVSLTPVRVEELCGFLFVNLDPHAAPLSEVGSQFAEELKRYVPELGSLRKVGTWVEEREANWKLVIENDVECYHCRTAHPYLSSRLNLAVYRSVDNGALTTHLIEREAERDVPAGCPTAFVYWYLWPDTEARVMPGPSNFAIYTTEPLGPTRTRLHYHHFVGASVTAADLERIRHDPEMDPTVAEDVALVESVQRGLRSLGYRGSSFVVDEDSVWTEHSVHHFQLLVADALCVPTAQDDLRLSMAVGDQSRPREVLGQWLDAATVRIRMPCPLAVGTPVQLALEGSYGLSWRQGRVSRLVEPGCDGPGMTVQLDP